MFIYDVFDEYWYFELGKIRYFFILENFFNSLENLVKVGVIICEDLWNDEVFWGRLNYICDFMKELVV